MYGSTFERLAKRFSRYEDKVDVAQGDDLELEQVMWTAGETLRAVLKDGQLSLGDMPGWLTKPRAVIETVGDSKTGEPVDIKVVPWATYWWHAVLWLTRNHPTSGIVLPSGNVSRVKPVKQWWGDFGGQCMAVCDKTFHILTTPPSPTPGRSSRCLRERKCGLTRPRPSTASGATIAILGKPRAWNTDPRRSRTRGSVPGRVAAAKRARRLSV